MHRALADAAYTFLACQLAPAPQHLPGPVQQALQHSLGPGHQPCQATATAVSLSAQKHCRWTAVQALWLWLGRGGGQGTVALPGCWGAGQAGQPPHAVHHADSRCSMLATPTTHHLPNHSTHTAKMHHITRWQAERATCAWPRPGAQCVVTACMWPEWPSRCASASGSHQQVHSGAGQMCAAGVAATHHAPRVARARAHQGWGQPAAQPAVHAQHVVSPVSVMAGTEHVSCTSTRLPLALGIARARAPWGGCV